jgi:hypothetical protein
MLLRFLADAGSNKLVRQESSHVVPRLGVDAQAKNFLVRSPLPFRPFHQGAISELRSTVYVELERHPRQTLAGAQYYYVSIAGLSAIQQHSGRRRSIVIENMFSTRLRMHA